MKNLIDRYLGPESAFIKAVAKYGFRQDIEKRIKIYLKLAAMIKYGKQLQASVISLRDRMVKKSKTEVVAVVLQDVVSRLEKGMKLADALDGYIPIGEQMLIRAGEQSGQLPAALELAVEQTLAAKDIKSQAISSLMQPIFLFSLLMAGLFIISRVVIPKLTAIFPVDKWQGPAKILYLATEFINSFWFILFIGILVFCGIAIVFSFPKWTGKLRSKVDILPPWSFFRIVVGSGWLMSLAALIRSGVTLVEAIKQMRDTAGNNYWLKKRLNQTLFHLNNGMTLGEALDTSGTGFPDTEIIEDLITYASLPGFDDVLYKLGRDWMEGSRKMILRQGAQLKVAVIVLFGVVVGGVAFGVISLQMQLGSYFTSMSGF